MIMIDLIMYDISIVFSSGLCFKTQDMKENWSQDLKWMFLVD